jgi:hypothetical protein
MVHIDDLFLLRNAQVALGILSSYVIHRPFYFTQTIPLSFSFLSFLASFNKKVLQICEDNMGPRSWESI